MKDGHGYLTDSNIRNEWSRRREVREHSFLHAIPDLMFLIRRDGTYLDYQPTKDIQPYVPPSEFLGRQVLDVLPPSVGGPCQHLIDLTLIAMQGQTLEYELPVDGAIHRYEARIVPSSPNEVLTIVREIANRDQAEPEGGVASHFRSVFEKSREAIGLIHRETLIQVNIAFAELFGYRDPKNLRGRPMLVLIAPASRLSARDLFENWTFEKPTPHIIWTRGLRDDGWEFNLEVRASEYQHQGRVFTMAIASETGRRASRDFSKSVPKTRVNADKSIQPRANASNASRIETPRGLLLTPRETQILALLAEGNSTKQAAATLGIAYKTADVHRTRIMEKLGVHETASMVRFAIRAGLIDP